MSGMIGIGDLWRGVPRQESRGNRRQEGFTLIELMIVVAVVAILAAIALPSYNDSVRKGRRGQAKADLMELAQILERHYTVHGSYLNNRDGTAFALPVTQSPQQGTAFYTISAPTRSAGSFVLSAAPTGAQAVDTCGSLGVSHTGLRTSSTGNVQSCF